MIGEVVAGRYDLERELGGGPTGTVYQGLDRQRRRLVAVKLIHQRLCADPGQKLRVLDHLRALAVLQHPRIVRVLDAGVFQERVYVVTELADGGSLRSLLESDGRLDLRRAIAIATEVAEALDFAHRHGLVHGDLCPENVLLDAQGNVTVSDFGIAEVMARDLDGPEAIPFRSAYAVPPERSATGHHADVYSLGVILYEMLTGHIPPVVTSAHADNHYAPSRVAKRGVPPWLERLVDSILRGGPDRGPLDAATLLATLKTPTEGALARPMPEPIRWPPRRPLHKRLFRLGGRTIRLLLGIGLPIALGCIIVAAFATVNLVVNSVLAAPFSSLAQVETPYLIGLPLSQASDRAASMGLQVARSSEQPTDGKPKDTVLAQFPAAGISIRRGTMLHLAVSSGIKPPSVIGKIDQEAKTILEQTGWTVGSIDQMPTLWTAEHTVVQQNPAPDQVAADRGPVKIVVAVLPPNLARSKPVAASNGTNPQAAVDDNVETAWVAGSSAPVYIEINLQGPHKLQRIDLVVQQNPNGWVAHEIWVSDSRGNQQKVHTFSQTTSDRQVLSQTFTPALQDVVKVRIVTVGSVGMPAWREIRIY